LSREQLDQQLGGRWVPSRRFGIRQSEKIRVIDDYSESEVNLALGSVETIAPGDLDVIAACLRAHLDALTLEDETRPAASFFRGLRRHADHKGSALEGRMFDLSQAYRQLARQRSHACFTVIAVFDPDLGEPLLYEQVSLAFGASSSVLSFNWTAAALNAALVELFRVCGTSFFDDFCVFELAALAASADRTTQEFFSMLGWTLKDLPPFSAHPEPLGAVVNLSQA